MRWWEANKMFFRREKESVLDQWGREDSLRYNNYIRKELETLLNRERQYGTTIAISGYSGRSLDNIESWIHRAEMQCRGHFVMDFDLKNEYDRLCRHRLENELKEKLRKEEVEKKRHEEERIKEEKRKEDQLEHELWKQELYEKQQKQERERLAKQQEKEHQQRVKQQENCQIRNQKIRKLVENLLEEEKVYNTAIHSYSTKGTLEFIDFYIEHAKYDCGDCFKLDHDLKVAYDRFKTQCAEYDNEEKRKQEEEHQRKLAEARKRAEEMARIQEEHNRRIRLEQTMLAKQEEITEEIKSLLVAENYTNIRLNISQAYKYSSTGIFGYKDGNILTEKDDYSYSVSFESSDQLPYEKGLILLRFLARIMAQVDFSCSETRNANIEKLLLAQGLSPQNSQFDFEIVNDSLATKVVYCEQEVLLKFYTNKTKLVPMDFDSMDGHQFEHFCAEILKNNGYENLNVTRGSGDQGIDIIAFRDGIKYGIQCKCYSSDIGNKAVQEVFAGKTFYECHIGVVLTNQFFTKSAIDLAKKNGIILWDRKKLLELIKKANCDN